MCEVATNDVVTLTDAWQSMNIGQNQNATLPLHKKGVFQHDTLFYTFSKSFICIGLSFTARKHLSFVDLLVTLVSESGVGK